MKIIPIDGTIGVDVTVKDFRAQMQKVGANEALTLEISSPGGLVSSGLTISNLIRAHKGPVEAKVMSVTASMGTYIALAADKVVASSDAIFMIHNASTLAIGDQNQLRKSANLLERTSNLLAQAYAKKTGESIEKIKNLMDEETFFYGQEIVDAGFADSLEDSETQEAREDAEIMAKLAVEDCQARIKEGAKEDFEQVAAHFKDFDQKAEKVKTAQEKFNGGAKDIVKALKTEKQPKKETKMDLEQFFKENPEAKSKFDAEFEAKKTEPVTKTNTSTLAIKALKSDSYPPQVKDIAGQVLTGEAKEETLKAVMAMVDINIEKEKLKTAQKESKELGDTPAQDHKAEGEKSNNQKATEEAQNLVDNNKGVR